MKLPDRDRWERLGPLLDELLDLPAPMRDERLQALRSQDAALAADVESLLAANERAEGARFLTGAASSAPGFETLLQPSLEGRRLGAYRLVALLGQGGSGSVWRARRDDGQFEGEAAIKLLHLSLLGQAGAQRFRREGAILARLTHPHIARLLDAGITDGGQPYLVLELIDGERIDRHCDEGRLGVEQRVALFVDVLAAVAHAHNHLVIHRDLKPTNILVSRDGDVKLLDFGIAKLLDDDGDAAEATQLTREGGRALTPEYAAPEQLRGEPVSTATDVYALGVVLYQLLSGRHPTAPEGAAAPQVMRSTLDTEPLRLSDAITRAASPTNAASDLAAIRRFATPLKLASALRGDLDNIVAKALKKAPAERYANASAFADDLRRYLNNEAVAAHADSVRYRVGKFVQRHRVAVLVAMATAAVLLATSAIAVRQMIEANRQREAAENEAARASSTREFLYRILTDAGPSDRPLTITELLARAEQSAYAQHGSGASKSGVEQLIQLSDLYTGIGGQKKALELAEAAHRNATSAGFAALRRQAACALGRQYHYAARTEESAALLDPAISELRRQDGDAETLVSCLSFKADLELTLGHADAAVSIANEAVARARSAARGSALSQIAPRMQLAIAQRVAGQTQQADASYRDLVALLEASGLERHVDAVLVYNGWGSLRSDIGDITGSVRLIESAIEIGRAARPGGAPDYVTSLNYAQRLLMLERLDEAERHFLLTRSAASAEGDPDFEFLSLLGAATVCRKRGDLAASRLALDATVQFAREHFPALTHPAQRAVAIETGYVQLADESFAAAAATLREVVRSTPATRVHKPDEVILHAALARAELGLGHSDVAASEASEARTLGSRFALPGEVSYWVGYGLLAQAEVEQALGHAESARRAAAQAEVQLAPSVGKNHPLTHRAIRLSGDAAAR